MRSSRPRLLVAALAGGAVLAAAAWAWSRPVEDEGRWVEVERGDVVREVEISGTLRAAESTLLGPPQVNGVWNFKISFLIPEGTEVVPGEPVAGFDDSELRRRLEDRRADAETAAKTLEKMTASTAKELEDLELQIAEAESRLRKARLAVDVPAELVAAAELAEARIDLDLARYELAGLEATREAKREQRRLTLTALAQRRDRALERVAELERDIERMRVRAPSAGTVIYVSRRGDDKPAVGDSIWHGRDVVEIPDLSRMLAECEVDEADSGALAVGQPVRFRLDAHPQQLYTGRIASIASTVQQRRARRQKVVEVEVELDATDEERMRPGMRLRGTVAVERAEGVLVLPLAAVAADEHGPRVVRRTALGREEIRPRLGLRGRRAVEVVDGLAEGEGVLLLAEDPS